MPKYIVERLFEVGEDQMPDVSRQSNRVLATMPEITWVHSHVVVDETGKVRTFCIYEAPDEDAVRRHAKALGLHTVEGITEIAGDVTLLDEMLIRFSSARCFSGRAGSRVTLETGNR